MMILFAVGVLNLAWIAALSVSVLVKKLCQIIRKMTLFAFTSMCTCSSNRLASGSTGRDRELTERNDMS